MDFLKLSFGVGMRNSGWIWGCLVHPSSHSVAARSTKDSSERSCRARPRSRGKLGVFCGFSVVEIVFDRSRWPGTFGARFFSRKPGLGWWDHLVISQRSEVFSCPCILLVTISCNYKWCVISPQIHIQCLTYHHYHDLMSNYRYPSVNQQIALGIPSFPFFGGISGLFSRAKCWCPGAHCPQ